MKVLPFKIPKSETEILIYQEDKEIYFYDKLHQHIEIQISYIVKGEGTLIIGDSINKYKTDDIFVIGSNIPHVFKSDTNDSEISFMMTLFFRKNSFGEGFFNLKNFETFQPFFKKSEYGFKVNSNKKELKHMFLKLKKALKIEQFILLFEIINLINLSKTNILSSFIYTKNYSNNEGKRMSDVFDYSLNNFSENISLKNISEVANMTSNAFCRYFKQRTNKSYIQFLTELRIDHATKLLRKNKDLSIIEVSTLSGFNNISNFNRKFKLLKKTTPLKYKLG
ncbi:MAG: helix-turn-helix domain-containing protein [Flavobacteriaceae bacterium]|nr:helix-turn-helix domain-containing protein [Flavobacteriaceae bacterium]